ncbi:YgjP-like metallopeptidase domain-containing protein [Actinomadura sp. 3N407]|uniref:YgjP-like metallopeptidase domain-containing protein n=1 Tax=Actinomadura sp. 3N407 TaxID=3457423 RepID=UPI003FCDBB07
MNIDRVREGSRLRSPDRRDFTATGPARRNAGCGWWAVPADGGRRVFLTQTDLDSGWRILDNYRIVPYGAPDLPADLADALAAAVPAGIEWVAATSTRRRSGNVGLTVDEHARLHITAPAAMPAADVADLVTAHAAWIRRHVYRTGHGGPPPPAGQTVKEMVSGEGFPWLGRPTRLAVVDTPDAPPAERTRDGFGRWVRVRSDLDDRGRADAVIALYQAEGRDLCAGRGAPLLARAGYDLLPQWEVTTLPLSRRWATYYPRTHTIRVHWPLMQLDLAVIDYAIARALWHAQDPDRRISLDVLLPGAADAARRLADTGRHVWDGAIRCRARTSTPRTGDHDEPPE